MFSHLYIKSIVPGRVPGTIRKLSSLTLRAHKQVDVNLPRSAHIDQLSTEKDLIFRVLESCPSKREAKSYLNRFEVKKDNIVSPSRYSIALITLKAPMLQRDMESVSNTLACIKRMGIAPVVLLENVNWKNNIFSSDCPSIENFREHRQIMIQDGLAVCDMIEFENVKTRLISSGVFIHKSDNAASEVDPEPILSCLRTDAIPVLLPISCTLDSKNVLSTSYDSIAALSKWFSRYNPNPSFIDDKKCDVMRVVVVNSRGGIPDENDHIINFVNLQDDLEGLVIQSGSWKGYVAPDWKNDLDLVYSSLAYLPATTSAIVVSASSVDAVINNLITDKPPISPSLPQCKEDAHDVTILRYGLKVVTYNDLEKVNIDKVWNLMEASFGKKIDKDKYLPRLLSSLSHLIVAGDYQGLAIVTSEPGGVCYLDKFAVDPQSQGIGVADVLWQRLQQQCPNLMWRSRPDNGVNKWYFERSDGNIMLDSAPWRMFWYGDAGLKRIKEYTQVAASIPATFVA